jgi:pyruvate dehydrogenase E2 component (dihydrolipoamide acetyltransferase)
MDIAMPRLSDSMETGTILTWLKDDGERVEIGDELVEIETDKATMTYESPSAGVLAILAAEGSTLAVDEPIARLSADAADAAPATTSPSLAVSEVVPPKSARAVAGNAVPPEPSGTLVAPEQQANGNRAELPVRATPLARRLAADHGIDLGSIVGRGPRGRVTRSDVVSAGSLDVESPVPRPETVHRPTDARAPVPASPPLSSAAAIAPEPQDEKTVQELTRTQQVIARRMADTKATVPEFHVQTDVQVDALLALRSQLKQATDNPPSVNDFIVKAAALALREFPLVNGSYREGHFELHDRVNVGIAVAADGSLVVPTITDADTRSVGSIAAQARRLARAVRDGTVTPPELSGATFTVSNLGMYGMTAITPVINAPQAAILGVGAARPVLARVDGEIVDRHLMTLTLSCDHRILYGADASQFLFRVRELLEQPLQLAF